MNTYHFCYLIGKELCTGINIVAKDYLEALKQFNKKMPEKNILYISILNS